MVFLWLEWTLLGMDGWMDTRWVLVLNEVIPTSESLPFRDYICHVSWPQSK